MLRLEIGASEANTVAIADVYKQILDNLNFPNGYRIPYAFAEDETTVLPMLEYWASSNAFVGIAGTRPVTTGEKAHQPLKDHSFYLGDNFNLKDMYRQLLTLFDTKIIGSYMRVIMCVPLHPALPALPLVVELTDNTFETMHVLDEYVDVYRFAARHLTPIFNTFPLGNASDGDGRRSALQQWFMSNAAAGLPQGGLLFEGTFRSFAVDWPGIRLHGVQLVDEPLKVSGLHMQDPIHDIKKLYCSAFVATRSLLIWHGIASHDSIFAAVQWFTSEEQAGTITTLGISCEDLARSDKQNFGSVLRLCSKNVQNLLILHYQKTGTKSSLSTALYLNVIWKVKMIFFSTNFTVAERLGFCGYVISFIALWLHDLDTHSVDHPLSACFMTIQSCRDIILSLNTTVLLAAHFYDINQAILSDQTRNGPLLDFFVAISKYGSDDLERLFSRIGGWGEIESNKRNFTFLDGLLKIMDHIHLLQQEKVQGVFIHSRHHKFGERSILRDDEPVLDVAPSGTNIPNRDVIKALLDAGFEDAKRDMKSTGANCEATITVAFDGLYKRLACNSKPLADFAAQNEAPNPDEGAAWEDETPSTESVVVHVALGEVGPPNATDSVLLQMELEVDDAIAPDAGCEPNGDEDGETLGEDVAPLVSSSEAQAGTPLALDALDAELDAAAPEAEEEESEMLLLHLHVRAEVNIQVDDQADAAEAATVATNPTQGHAAVPGAARGVQQRRNKESFYVDIPSMPDKPMHIHRLLSMLNKCARLGSRSKDRLKRIAMADMLAEQFKLSPLVVRTAGPTAGVPWNGDPGSVPLSGRIGLGSDIVFVFQAPIQGTNRISVRFWIGRVCRMLVHQPGSVRRIVTDSIALASIKDGSIKDIFVLCAWFKPLTNDYRACTQYSFITHEAELKAVAATTALCETSLTLVENNAHALPASELSIINKLFSALSGCFSNAVAEPTQTHPGPAPPNKPTSNPKPPSKRSKKRA